MFEVEINGAKHKAEISFYTAWLYESEFQSKLIQDYMKGQDFDEVTNEGGMAVAVVKFDSIDWVTVTKILWAAIKTAEESTPPFEKWLRESGNANLWDARNEIDSAITDCFFRSLDTRAEE